MGLIRIIVLFLGGAIALSDFITQKNAKAGEIVQKLIPFKTIIGFILAVWGIIDLVRFIFVTSGIFYFSVITGIIFIVAFVVELALGTILAMSFLKSRKELPAEKLEMIDSKLLPFQTPLGFVAIFLGLYLLIFTVILSPYWSY
ncbi:MAG: hypothetical protein A2Y33_09080 [Spirochaetes bacterium GWF1_51_8]|nr:MAG: hypothetical protein A2Y33_09080 [Spirochaetes bacterium GWF1_51_8]